MSESHLTPEAFRSLWERKPVLRTVYRDYYARMEAWRLAGVTVEIGSGSGNLRDEMDEVIASDIVRSDFLDLSLDAQRLPFAGGSIDNIVGVDVLHHIEFPRRFLCEAARVLAPGGRVILMEPAITPVSKMVFRFGHPEPVDMSADPLAEGLPDRYRNPFDSNQAIPTLLVGRDRARLLEAVGLEVAHVHFLSLLAYPLSGGFREWSLLPVRWVDRLLRIERPAETLLGPAIGFRLMIVLQRPSQE